MKDSRKIELFDNLFDYIVKTNDGDEATEILFNLGMTTNEIDDCAGIIYREDDNDDDDNESEDCIK